MWINDVTGRAAKLFVPANKAMPIAAELELASPAVQGAISVSLDWRYTEGERWTIDIVLASGQRVALSEGGNCLTVDGVERTRGGEGEYPALYAQFAALVGLRRSQVDVEPLRIVADAFMLAERTQVEAFTD